MFCAATAISNNAIQMHVVKGLDQVKKRKDRHLFDDDKSKLEIENQFN